MFKFFGKKKKEAAPAVRARFDAAQTTRGNARHWRAADHLSADAEADPHARATLRDRARYEVQNNAYARGLVLTLANDVVGTGPRLQMLYGDEELNHAIEHDFGIWAKRVQLSEKLRTMRMARCQDGEAFALLAQNPNLDSDVRLDIQLIEADRVASESPWPVENEVDGIFFDRYGNPVSYTVLKDLPGGPGLPGREFLRVDAANMVHYFRRDRPGQHRGVPEITSVLPLFAQLRRYTLAVLDAAETAADFAGILYTDAPAGVPVSKVGAMESFALERNVLVTMPNGWKMEQVEARQPVTGYGEFKREVLNEIARSLNMPYNIAAGNSSGYNYASGRLDHQTYYRALKIDRAALEDAVLDRILEIWLREWRLVRRRRVESCACRHLWFWDGQEHVDPEKEANAQATRLNSLTTSLATEFARQGKDWEVELEQIAKEQKKMKELGLTGLEGRQ